MRGSKVLVICPPPVGLPPVICGERGVDPVPRTVLAAIVPCDPEIVSRQIKVGVVEDVVGFGAEFDFEGFNRCGEIACSGRDRFR